MTNNATILAKKKYEMTTRKDNFIRLRIRRETHTKLKYLAAKLQLSMVDCFTKLIDDAIVK